MCNYPEKVSGLPSKKARKQHFCAHISANIQWQAEKVA